LVKPLDRCADGIRGGGGDTPRCGRRGRDSFCVTVETRNGLAQN